MTTTGSTSEPPPRPVDAPAENEFMAKLTPEQRDRMGDRLKAKETTELTPEQHERMVERMREKRAERKEVRKAERKAQRQAARRAAREVERTRRKEAKRLEQWEQSSARAKETVESGSDLVGLSSAGLDAEGDAAANGDGEPILVYRAGGGVGAPVMRMVDDIRIKRTLIWNLARSDLKSENYNTLFGQLWLILNPLLLAGDYVLGRSVIRPMGNPAERNYLICYLVMGVFFFQFTSKAESSGSRSIVRNKQMMLNTSAARTVFPLATAMRTVFDFVPLLITLAVLRAILGQPVTSAYLFFPVIAGIQFIFNLGLIFGLGALTVFFRDLGNFLTLSTRLWLWTTPVLYTASEIPPGAKPYLQLNPLYPLYAALEQVTLGQWPSMGYLLWALAWAVPVCVAGVIFFLVKERDFAVRL
jgi:ABC-type polysaccharide/polyol phosphate export permease